MTAFRDLRAVPLQEPRVPSSVLEFPFQVEMFGEIQQSRDGTPRCAVFQGGTDLSDPESTLTGEPEFVKEKSFFLFCIQPSAFICCIRLGRSRPKPFLFSKMRDWRVFAPD